MHCPIGTLGSQPPRRQGEPSWSPTWSFPAKFRRYPQARGCHGPDQESSCAGDCVRFSVQYAWSLTPYRVLFRMTKEERNDFRKSVPQQTDCGDEMRWRISAPIRSAAIKSKRRQDCLLLDLVAICLEISYHPRLKALLTQERRSHAVILSAVTARQ